MKKFLLVVFVVACLAFIPPQWDEQSGWIFLASGDGSDIQSALDTGLPNYGNRWGKTLVLGQGIFEITETLRINEREGVTILGSGNSLNGTVLRCNTPGRACIEILGSDNILLQNLNITGVDMAVGVMTGRTSASLNSSRITFRDLYVYGNYDYAAFYVISSETNRWDNVHANAQSAAQSVITIANYNEYNVPASLPLAEGVGGYSASISNSGLTGQSIAPLRIFGSAVTVEQSYIYTPGGTASIEVIGGGGVTLRAVGFEGSPFASLRLTYRAGEQNYFVLRTDAPLGNPAQYAIWADNGTLVRDSVISDTGAMPVRFWDLVFSDLTRWGNFDSRAKTMTARSCFGLQVFLGQNDTLTCASYVGVTIHNQSSLWAPKIEQKGFAP